MLKHLVGHSRYNSNSICFQNLPKLCDLSCDETSDLFNLVRQAQKLVERFREVSSSTISIQVHILLTHRMSTLGQKNLLQKCLLIDSFL